MSPLVSGTNFPTKIAADIVMEAYKTKTYANPTCLLEPLDFSTPPNAVSRSGRVDPTVKEANQSEAWPIPTPIERASFDKSSGPRTYGIGPHPTAKEPNDRNNPNIEILMYSGYKRPNAVKV